MASELSKDYLIEVAKDRVDNASIIHKFGQSDAVGTTFVPVSRGNIYQTPQAASATTLRIKAGGDAGDTTDGAGARAIMLQGIDETGALASEIVVTAGASASSATTTTFMRLFRAFVYDSGAYATTAAGSHVDDIVIENGAGGTDWATIFSTGYPRAQTEIGMYTIPAGYVGYPISSYGFSDSSFTTELIFMKREKILDADAPYEGMRMLFGGKVEGGQFTLQPSSPFRVKGPADVGFLAKVNQTTATVEVGFELLLLKS